jgi:cytochrome c-type biogenesis protein CcmE
MALTGVDHDAGEESVDAKEEPSAASTRPGVRRGVLRGHRRRQLVAFLIIAAALGLLIWRGLGNATVYFKTADEAVAQRASLGAHRFRIEGTVQPGVSQVGQNVGFVIGNNGVFVPVLHHGDPPQLFKPGVPVVLEGRFSGTTFASDRIMVKHTESYVAKHPERLRTAETSVPSR